MSRLFLHCGLCARKQADGLISRGYWGHIEFDNGTALRACPACKGQYPDWEQRLLATLNGAGAPIDQSAFSLRRLSESL